MDLVKEAKANDSRLSERNLNINPTNSERATIARIRLSPSRTTNFKQSEFNIGDLINVMPNTQQRAIANTCNTSYTEQFLAHVNIGI
jgi:hypothetical protein